MSHVTHTAPEISADATLNEIVARVPEALPVLQRAGLDTCCGGALPLRVAAERHQLSLVDLLAELNRAAGR